MMIRRWVLASRMPSGGLHVSGRRFTRWGAKFAARRQNMYEARVLGGEPTWVVVHDPRGKLKTYRQEERERNRAVVRLARSHKVEVLDA